MVSGAQVAFVNTMSKKLVTSPSGVPVGRVMATGATDIRIAFPHDARGVMVAYVAGLKVAFGTAIGSIGLAAVFGLFSARNRLETNRMRKCSVYDRLLRSRVCLILERCPYKIKTCTTLLYYAVRYLCCGPCASREVCS